jgi:signal transduction histidine kinase
LVNNSIKHAGASQVVVQLFHHRDKTWIVYSDNGRGFDTSLLDTPELLPGHGISNIMARIRFLHGQCSFSSSPGKGVNVKIILENIQ